MSSLSSSAHLEPSQQRPAPLARQNSSFFGAIKSIVSAPLSWFAQQDESETGAKRRRAVEQRPTDSFLPVVTNTIGNDASDDAGVDDATRRSKRMRLNSPPRPTASVTQHHRPSPAASSRRVDPARRSSLVPRSSSAVLPSSRLSRSHVSPSRHPKPLQRTMSIDPPHLNLTPSRRDKPALNTSLYFGSEMDMTVDERDVSMSPAPLSPRPSFRMRASMTPQPQQAPARHISEPPPLNALVQNPLFLRPPVQPTQEAAPAPTLGAIAESTRPARSPARQRHSSLMLSSDDENHDAPSARAIHQLDIYKTPLVPTRLRSSNLPTSISGKHASPDMFKSRRNSRLILMQDEKERYGRRVSGSGKSPLANETKPYAGEGGMKKLLARHKAEKEDDPTNSVEVPEETKPPPISPPPPAVPPPPPTGSDWFATTVYGSSDSSAGSSLRVGRAKTSRNHIQRPAKSKFSANYEEDADDCVDEDESTKERRLLEEAAKKVPVFQMPAGFSFAKETPAPVLPADEVEKAKEPPMKALPFSFSKPAPTPSPFAAVKADAKIEPPEATPATSFFSVTPSIPSLNVVASTPDSKSDARQSSEISGFPAVSIPAFASSSNGAVPNFFANSTVVKETPIPSVTSNGIPNFFAKPSTVKEASAVVPTVNFSNPTIPTLSSEKQGPVKDLENPLWTGEKSGGAASSAVALAFPASGSLSSDTSSKLPFSFGAPIAAQSEVEKKTGPEPVAPKPLIASAPSNVFGAPTTTSSSLLGEPPKPTSPFPLTAPAPPQSTPSPLPFTFGAPASTPAPTPVEPAKPAFSFGSQSNVQPTKPFSFGSSTPSVTEAAKSPFSFGQPTPDNAPTVDTNPQFGSGGGFSFGTPSTSDKSKEVQSSFAFGAAPNTPPSAPAQDVKTPAPFSFGQSVSSGSSGAGAPLSFAFSGGGSTGADVSNKPSFMFGAPATIERPVTPPKSVDQEFRMEESPTRDLQTKAPEPRPTLNGGFSFGPSTSTAGSPFGGPSTAFSFGGSAASNPFAQKDKPAEAKPFSFGSGVPQAPQITTSFSFGKDENRPSSAGGFSFGQTPTSATNTAAAPFSFGQTAAFGAANGSAPSSPSTFNQPAPFAFGAAAPAAPAANPFSFGSQPNSPAGVNTSLPGPGFGGGGFGQAAAPSSPFSGPIALAPSTSSGGAPSLFTIGSAPAPGPPGARAIRKLPRRGGVKR